VATSTSGGGDTLAQGLICGFDRHTAVYSIGAQGQILSVTAASAATTALQAREQFSEASAATAQDLPLRTYAVYAWRINSAMLAFAQERGYQYQRTHGADYSDARALLVRAGATSKAQ